jgi:hypothetical protein
MSVSCPQCDSDLDLGELWRAASRFGFLRPHVGVICPRCDARLRVSSSLATVSGFIAWVFLFAVGVVAALVVPIGWSRSERQARVLWVIAGLVGFGGLAIHQSVAPGLLRLRLLAVGEKVRFPLAKKEPEPGTEAPKESAEEALAAWNCVQCGEENPGTFNECWKCLATRPEASGG